jgi:hypothetical protein
MWAPGADRLTAEQAGQGPEAKVAQNALRTIWN